MSLGRRTIDADKNGEDDSDKAKNIPLIGGLKATHKFLTNEEQQRHTLVEASKRYYREGLQSAQDYLGSKGMSGWKIDDALSTPDGIVVERPGSTAENPRIEIAYRGTDKFNWNDLKADARIAVGLQDYPEGEDQVRSVQEKYNTTPEHVSGYSLGGNRAHQLAEKFQMESTLFNPFITPQGRKVNLAKDQTILRTTDDLTTLPLAWSEKNDRVKVKSFATKTNTLNPVKAHALDQFADRTEDNIRENGYISDIHDASSRVGEYGVYDNIEDALKNQTQRMGQQGLFDEFTQTDPRQMTFTDAIHRFNSGRPNSRDTLVDENGNILLNGANVNEEGLLARTWKDVGGTFSQNELDAMNNRQVMDDPFHSPAEESDLLDFNNRIDEIHANTQFGLSPEERKEYANADDAKRQQLKQKALDDFERVSSTNYTSDQLPANAPTLEPAPAFGQTFTSGLRSSFTPGALGAGFAGSFAANKAMNIIDPHNQIPELPRDAVEGGFSGYFTGLAGATLTGAEAAVGAPEILGGAASYLAKDLSSTAIDVGLQKAGVSEPTSKAVADVGSDVAAGATAGAAYGLTMAPETLGASVAIGAAGGAILGGLKDLWESKGRILSGIESLF